MTLTPQIYGDLPQTPFSVEAGYMPDQLRAGDFKIVSANALISSGASTLVRGTVLGQQSLGGATAAAKAGNTGNATLSAVTVGPNATPGVYTVVWTSATAFNVFDPRGRELRSGANGAAFSDDIGFTATAGGTAMVAGDTINVTVAAGTGNYVTSIATATDGSQNPSAILADYCNPTAGAVNAGIYLTGEFDVNYITFDSSWTVAALTPLLQAKSIYLKNAVGNLGGSPS
jgi:hypothetical protein